MENFNKLNLKDGDIITEDKLAIIDSNTDKYNANKTEILNTLDSHTSQLNETVQNLEATNNNISNLNISKVSIEDLEKTNSKISDLDSTKANKSDLANQFNPKGSCLSTELPTNASVKDMWYCTDKKYNMAWNGTSWYQCSMDENAYINELNTVIENVKDSCGYSEIEMTDHFYINLSTGVGNVVELTPISNYDFKYVISDCVSGDIFTISGQGASGPRLYGFVDADNKLLSVADAGVTVNKITVTVPEGATKIIINGYRNTIKCWKGNRNTISELSKTMTVIKENTSSNSLFFSQEFVTYVEFELGSLGNTGEPISSTKRARSKRINLNGNNIISASILEGYKYLISLYKDDKYITTLIGFNTKSQDIFINNKDANNIVVVVAKNADTDISVVESEKAFTLRIGIKNAPIVNNVRNNYIEIPVKWEKGNIVDGYEKDSENRIRTGIIILPWKNAKIKIETTGNFRHQIVEYFNSNDFYKNHDISDNYEYENIEKTFIRVVIHEITWSRTITIADGVKIYMQIKEEKDKIPGYYDNIANSLKESIRSNNNVDGLNILFLSDTHMEYINPITYISNENEALNQMRAVVDIANKCDVDCIIHGGDIIHGYNSTKEKPLEAFNKSVDILKDAKCPVLVSRGNHDDNSYYNYAPSGGNPKEYVKVENVITQEEWLSRVVNPLCKTGITHDSMNKKSTYYYYDLPQKYTRLIVLDPYDYPLEDKGDGYAKYVAETWFKFSHRQVKWLCEEALNINRDWSIVVIVHGILIDGSGMSKPANSSEIVSILENYNARGTYVNAGYDINVDFSTAKGVVKTVIGGHTHIDMYDRKSGIDYFWTGAGYCCNYDSMPAHTMEYYECPSREKHTETEPLFDYYGIGDNNIVRKRFGAGNSQSIPRQ